MNFVLSPLVKYGIIVAVVLAVVFGIYKAGAHSVQSKWDLAKAEVKEKIVIQKVVEEKITEKVVTKYVDRIKEVKVKGDTIYVKVPEYVTKEDNDRCIINNGFVRVLNSAIANELPGPTDATDRADAGISLSEVAENSVRNYTTCNIYKERADSLMQWIKEQKAARP